MSRLNRASRLRKQNRALQQAVERLECRRLMTTYYVDNNAGDNGSNSNPGTALTAPFLTIQQAATVAQPGDTVDIVGGTYREEVIPAHSGTATAPITYQPYNNQKVVVSGANLFSGWTQYSGNIYQSSAMTWTMGGQDDQVFVDGQMINYARWPNTSLDVSHPNVEIAGPNTTGVQNSSGTITETIYDQNLTQPAGYWNGATIHVQSGDTWIYEAATITSYTRAVVNGVSYGVITYTSSYTDTQYYVAQAGDPFYITGDPYYTAGQFQNLDSAGEFYRDPNSGKVYLWTPTGDSPAAHVVEAKAREWAFDLSGLSYINLNGISIFAAGINSSTTSSHLTINGLSAGYVSQFENYTGNWTPTLLNGTPIIGGTGIVLDGNYDTIENSTIAYSAGEGVYLGGSNETVYNNVIHDVDYAGVNCAAITTSEFATTLSANDSISFNTLYNSGRTLIEASAVTTSKIDNNRLWNSMLQTDDGGAIYTFSGSGNGTEIYDNIISNSVQNIQGFDSCGIFLDGYSTGFTVDHNVISDATDGIKIYQTYANNIINNTINNTIFSINLSSYTSTGLVVNNITDNGLYMPFGAGGMTVSNNVQSSATTLYVSPSTGNYQLQSGSSAINAGTVEAPYTNGYVGSAPDDGAYEYGVTAWSAGASNTAAVVSALAVPSPWTSGDIGAPPIGGNSNYSNGVFAISGSGSDIWGSADQFQFADVPVTGNQTIVARIASQTNTNVWAKAGVMFRSTSAANSSFVLVAQTPGNGVNLMWRDASGNLGYTQVAALSDPAWVKLVRNGNVFTGYDSTDGINWTTIGSVTISLPATGLIGLAVSSHDTTLISTATFDNVSLTWPAPTGLTATSTGSGSVNLNWTAATGATGYQIQRSTDDVNFSTIGTVGTVTSYTDSNGLTAGTQYYYRLIYVTPFGSSPASAVATVSQPAPAPTGLSAAAGNTQTTVAWNAVAGAVSYDVYRSTTSGGEGSTPIATGITGLSYGDTNVRTNVTYYYKVTAVSSTGSQSAPSSEASVSAGVVSSVPGVILAANYDLGGEGVAYHDSDSINQGGAYRNDGVDIEGSSSSGYDIGWVLPGEWLNYTISVPSAGYYAFNTLTASPESGGTFQINIDGTNVSGSLTVPNTGGWQTFTSVPTGSVLMTAGIHVMRLAFNTAPSGNVGNFKSITVSTASAPAPAPSTPTGLTATAGAGSVALSWTAGANDATFNVYRATTAGAEGTTPLATGITSASYVDSTATAGNKYYYTVTGVNGTKASGAANESAQSSEVSATSAITSAAPTGVSATAGFIQTTVAWNAAAGAVSYDVYRSTTSGGEGSTPIATGITGLSYGDTNVRTNVTYYYEVTAVSSTSTQSAPSSEASVSAGVVSSVPGVILAANYDLGGEGVAYHDTDSVNQTGAYRNDGVDVENSAGGGYDVGWVYAGEWLNYTISVPTTGYYSFSTLAASAENGATFQINIDGTNVSGSLTVPNTGGWETFASIPTGSVLMTAGVHVMRLAFDTAPGGNVGNFKSITVATVSAPAPSAPTALTAVAGAGSVALSWTAGANDATFNLYRSTTAGGEGATPLVTGITSNHYVDTTATAGTKYYYTVTGVNGTKASGAANESAQSNEVSATSVITTVLDGSFESTSVNGTYTYNPTTANWKFTGNAGIEANGSAWNAAAAPDGTQAAFLQTLNNTSGGSVSQTVSFSDEGSFEFSFYAAQRNGYGIQPITVSVDGSVLATITPGSTSFASFTTPAVSLNAGAHVLSFATGAITAVDAASFIDKVSDIVVSTAPGAPTGVTAVAGVSQVSLSWTAPVGAVSYNVYRGSTAGGESSTPIATGVTGTTFTDTTAAPGVNYYYVTAFNGNAAPFNTQSAASAEVSANVAVYKLNGIAIGTAGISSSYSLAQAFDGNFGTFYYAPDTSLTDWVGLDLGAAQTITQIRYAPRAGFEFQMYGGQFQASSTPDFSSNVVTLYTINAIPVAGQFTTVPVSPGGTYRYVRYVGGNQRVDIAEMEVDGYGPPAPVSTKLTGTAIGTAGISSSYSLPQAFDGDLTTFYYAPDSNLTDWVGLNLGSQKNITSISFAPRAGWEWEMYGGQFQVSNTADFSSGVVTIYTVNAIPVSGQLTTVQVSAPGTYQYIRFTGGTQWVDIAEMSVSGY